MLPNFLFLIAAVGAETVGTFTGFGAVTILLPIATFMMPLREAIVLVSVFHLMGTFFRTLFFVRKINLKIALLFGIPSLIFSAIGASLLPTIDLPILSKIVGVALVAYAFYSLIRERVSLPKTNMALVGGGAAVGFVAGLIGTAGAVRGAFLTSWNLPPAVYLGTGALMGLGADAARVAVYTGSGLIKFEPILFISLGVAALIGTIIGKFLVVKTKEKIFARIIFIALVAAGLRLILINA